MKFNKFEIITTIEVEELLAYNLNDLGIEGVEIVNDRDISDEDKKKMFSDISPIIENDSEVTILKFFVPIDENKNEILKKVQDEIARLSNYFNVGDAKISITEVDDEQWKDRWKEFFKPFYIEDIYITPTWINEKQEEITIKIDPGSAFGTGLHETTRLCMKVIRNKINKGDTVLDIGCGSGILSILCDKLGAKEIVALDIDPNAIKVTEENFEINKLNNDKFSIYEGNIIEDKKLDEKLGYKKYDIIVANLLSEILIEMAEYFIPHLKEKGILITSGILLEKEEKVKLALKSVGFNEFETIEDGEWVSIIAKR